MEDIERIKEDLNRISPERTWTVDTHGHIETGCRCLSCYETTVVTTNNMIFCDEQHPEFTKGHEDCPVMGYTYEDAKFISKAPARIKELVEEVERLRAQSDHP